MPVNAPDLLISEVRCNGQKVFEVTLPASASRMIVQKGWRGSQQAENIIRAVEERVWRLWQVGQILIARQRDYFDSDNASEAYLQLKPLTQDEVAQELGIHKGSLARLVARSVVQTPRFGLVSLALFFGPAGGTLGRRTDVLAAHIQTFLKTEDPQRPYFSEQIRLHLQEQGLIPQTRDNTERLQMERLLRRVMQEYNLANRAQRRRKET